MKSWLR
jgi:eukaryotic-like serine/threonine-protein kinase